MSRLSPVYFAAACFLLLWPLTPFAAPAFFPIPCHFDTPPGFYATCGEMEVPEQWNSQDNRLATRFDVVVVGRGQQLGSRPLLLHLPGGPGATWDLNRFVTGAYWESYRRWEDAAGFDLVYVNPRGTRAEDGCYEASFMTDASEALATCFARLSAEDRDPSAYHQRNVAMDLRQLRQALGVSQWHVLGVSYGSRTALELAWTDPQGVKSLILDSPAYLPLPDLDQEAHSLRETLALRLHCDLCRPVAPVMAKLDRLVKQLQWGYLVPLSPSRLRQLNLSDAYLTRLGADMSGMGMAVSYTAGNLYAWLQEQLAADVSDDTLRTAIYNLVDGDYRRQLAGLIRVDDIDTTTGWAQVDNLLGITSLCREIIPGLAAQSGQSSWAKALSLSRRLDRVKGICERLDLAPLAPPALQGVQVPTYILAGTLDPQLSLAQVTQLAADLPQAQLRISDVEHGVLWNESDALYDTLQWLRRVELSELQTAALDP